jgi:hypothetical protein
MRANNHTRQRLQERLTADERKAVGASVRAAVAVHGSRGRIAVYAHRLTAHRVAECDSGSNGQNVVAIVENGRVKTVMLRRDNQPPTRHALRVDLVVRGA